MLQAIERPPGQLVLVVDDVPENQAVLHDALDESGYSVVVANNGVTAIERACALSPDIVLLDAVMPGMDGFEVCRRLKADLRTRAIPVVFMTGLTEDEHILAAFQAGVADYVTKPVRQSEVLARIRAHMRTASMVTEARSALDAFGHAVLVAGLDGRIAWQTPLARAWMQSWFADDANRGMPARVVLWLQDAVSARAAGQETPPLVLAQGTRRLAFDLAEAQDDGYFTLVLREESDDAQVQGLMAGFALTRREAEVLHWVSKGKTNRDIGDILGTSPRTVNKHLEHVFAKLGVETRTAAASQALARSARQR
ncbi:response regulator transcription factor [Massilia sp. CFBP9012]|uniref:response regulator transcription factor n=1 Tax=Massilia sp. CFBP9012 TaxID=3096531 RepID=UPI002A6AA1FD|nr:response regulator transcription factor [Massilia sp. CFBP9012]MDY0976560.1 response regulator transcription factor [Massilia sp. CFBP9012]